MIQLVVLPLEVRADGYLRKWQGEIDDLPDYADRVAQGKSRFSSRNTTRNATFKQVKAVLTRMCQGARRCAYCEDSVADEVEHVKPKDLYPEEVFCWDNYLYACGPCNIHKNNKFAVLHGAPPVLTTVTRPDGAAIAPPRSGDTALINPRAEDPLYFLFLDLLNTFTFTPRFGITQVEAMRARYTLEVLHLNDRDYLIDARRTAFGNYRARLVEYLGEKRRGAAPIELNRRRDELLKVGHQTVWREMQRPYASYPPLSVLFMHAPEALLW